MTIKLFSHSPPRSPGKRRAKRTKIMVITGYGSVGIPGRKHVKRKTRAKIRLKRKAIISKPRSLGLVIVLISLGR